MFNLLKKGGSVFVSHQAVQLFYKAMPQSAVVDAEDSVDFNVRDVESLVLGRSKARNQQVAARIEPVGQSKSKTITF